MKINHKEDILGNEVKTTIYISELGNADLTAEKEENLLLNFPKIIEFNKISFIGNMKITNNLPVVTTDVADGTTVDEVAIKDIINKQYIIDKDLNIEFKIDSTKIPESELTTLFSKREMLAQAKITLFVSKIEEAIKEKMAEIRGLSNSFEGETETVI